MVYLDSSVVLAHLLSEDRRPTDAVWGETLASSRLMEYEVRQRVYALEADPQVLDALLGRVAFIEMVDAVVARARAPFPGPVRTLDALHLASADFLREQGAPVELATYDGRMADVARRMGFKLFDLDD